MGSTAVRVGPTRLRFKAVALPDIQRPPEVGDSYAKFVQTTGGRTGLPAPRLVGRWPFLQFHAPLVWTTLSLTLQADGDARWEVVGASPFPRHWIYGPDRVVAAKVGVARFGRWWRESFGRKSPWGGDESPAILTPAETALERRLSRRLMREAQPSQIHSLREGSHLTHQGQPGNEIYLLLDGIVRVEVDGERLTDLGPGSILGEHATLEHGSRTATLIAVTPVRVAVITPDQLEPEELAELSKSHRLER